ncbi:hypothetical protein StoSoilB13_11090 [Arthrobacter sp. StoSoilB13]|nr:hypothetical protein StoSoilB13_11090 [Arthrobacter sp. StoSoilB13]
MPAETRAARTDSVSGLGLADTIFFSVASTVVLVATTAGSIVVPLPGCCAAGLEEVMPAMGLSGDGAVHADSASAAIMTRKVPTALPFS